MGVNVADIKLCVCRTVHLFLRVSYRFVQQHPYVSGTSLFLFALYIFLPSVLSFLFYFLPFLALTGFLLAFWIYKRSSIRSEKVEDKKLQVPKQPTAAIQRNRSAYLRNATSRRQRFKDKNEAWRTEAPTNASPFKEDQSVVDFVNSKSFSEVKETKSPDPGNNVDKDIEVSSKNEPLLGLELPVKLKPELVACDGLNSQANKFDSGGDETKNESSEDPEDEDEEEVQEEDKNKGMEWTEDDQKNLMDLGLSEIERNRRLESLIARRRARKLNKRKHEVESNLRIDIFPPGQIAKIITTKNDPRDFADGCKEMIDQVLALPGSAPSVLLPMRNPFDLPYDPHEEKPNLMADSFQQEFTVAHQKELGGFCRHESFCFGPAYPEESRAMGYHHHRYRRPSVSNAADKGEHDWLIEQLLFKGDLHAVKNNPIAVETRGIQTEDSPQARDNHTMELESDQEKGIPPNSESEFEIESEQTTQDCKSQSSHSSSTDNPKDVICEDVREVSKGYESTLSSSLNKSLNCRVPKSRLIKEPLCDFSPTAFDKNKMDDRFPYPDKVVCHTPTYSIASDLQVEVSELGSPPTVDGNNTDAESLNPDWEIEKEASFQVEQDDASSSLELPFDEIVSDLQEKEAKAMNVIEALSSKELGDQSSQIFTQISEELSIPADDDDEAINDTVLQKKSEALANMENTVTTRENVDGGLEILMKQEDDGMKTSSLEETHLNFIRYSNDGLEDSSGSRSDMDREHSEVGSKNVDLFTGNGDLSSNHDHSGEGSKHEDQITGDRDLGRADEHSEEDNKSTDQVTGNGNGDFVDTRKIEEQLELLHDNENQPNVLETEFQSSKDALKSNVENNLVTEGGVPLDTIVIIRSDVLPNQVNTVQSEFQKSDDAMKLTVEQHSVTDGGARLDTIDVVVSDASQNQVNDVPSEFRKPSDAMKSTVEQHPVTDGGVPLHTIDIIGSAASPNQVNAVQSESQKSNDATVKSTVEKDSVTDGGEPLDTIDVLGSDASRNQVNGVQYEFQKFNDDVHSTVEQHSATERELLDASAGLSSEFSTEEQVEIVKMASRLSSEYSIEEQIHMDKVSSLQDSITSDDHNAKAMEKDDNKPADSIEVESEQIKDFSGQNGDFSDLNAEDDHEKTDQNLSSLNSAPNDDLKISEITVHEEAAANPQVTPKEVEIETELTPTTSLTNKETEYESPRINKQEDLELDKDMESYSKDLNEMGLQKPAGSAHESPLGSSLSADKESQ